MLMGNLIREKRKKLGYTIRDIAKLMGVSPATVQRWESGEIQNMRQGRIAKLAELLEISPSEIMGWDKIETREKSGSAFYEILQDILDEKQIDIHAASSLCNIKESDFRKIFDTKMRTASLELALKISKGLKLPIEMLNGATEPQKKKPTAKESDELRKIMDIVSSLSPSNREKLLEFAYMYLALEHNNPENE